MPTPPADSETLSGCWWPLPKGSPLPAAAVAASARRLLLFVVPRTLLYVAAVLVVTVAAVPEELAVRTGTEALLLFAAANVAPAVSAAVPVVSVAGCAPKAAATAPTLWRPKGAMLTVAALLVTESAVDSRSFVAVPSLADPAAAAAASSNDAAALAVGRTLASLTTMLMGGSSSYCWCAFAPDASALLKTFGNGAGAAPPRAVLVGEEAREARPRKTPPPPAPARVALLFAVEFIRNTSAAP